MDKAKAETFVDMLWESGMANKPLSAEIRARAITAITSGDEELMIILLANEAGCEDAPPVPQR